MKIPQLARYNGTVVKAYDFVKDNVSIFPINVFKLIEKFNWKLLTYEQLATKNNCNVDDVCECLGKDGYSIYNGHNYTIAYNTNNDSGRINFTLAHEIGHIILEHHKDFEVTEILQDNFTIEEYKILENEANCFARNLLSPAPLVNQMKLWNKIFSMSSDFGITAMAARTRLSFLKNDLYYLNNKQIHNFQHRYKPFRICTKCKNMYINIDDKYCPLCGSKKLIVGDGFMIYKTDIETDENKKARECPRCGNEEILEGNYCKICGLELYNRCTNVEDDGFGNIIGGCNEICDTNARYCHKCGQKTSYYANNLLCNYTEYNCDKEAMKITWKEILDNLKLGAHMTLYANLLGTELVETNENTVRIDFKSISEFKKRVVSEGDNFKFLKESIKVKYRKDMKVDMYDLQGKRYFYQDVQPVDYEQDDELPF